MTSVSQIRFLRSRLRVFLNDRRGAVAVMSAFLLPLMIAMVGLVYEFGQGLLIKGQNQRIADAAVYAGALAYNSTGSTSSMVAAALSVAKLNGFSGSSDAACPPSAPAAPTLYVCLTSSPSGDGNQAVEAMVSSSEMLILAPVLNTMPNTAGGVSNKLSISSSSYAEIKTSASGCIMALSGSGTGVTVTSASGITADACAVESNATVSASSASTITTPQVQYNSSTAPSATSASTIAAPSGKTLRLVHAAVTDPLAGNSEVTAATSRLPTVEGLTSPAAPSVPSGSNLSFSASSWSGSIPSGCSTPTHSGSNWTLTCTGGGGTYDFGALSVTSTATLALNANGSSADTYNFSGGITVSSSAGLTTGPGTFNIAQGITIASASSATFGAGTFNVGPGASACTDGGKYSLCVESSTSLTMGGPSTFTFAGGVYAGSSATIELGAGTANAYDIGASSNGNAAAASSSSKLLFADALNGATSFQLNGNVTAASAACVALPDASEHDINGAIIANSASNTTLGSGIYTVSNYIDDESASGGSGCSGWIGGTADTGVTLVLGAKATPSSGTCSGMAICVLSASSTAMVAPTTGPTAGLAVIGPTSASNTAGALFQSASSGSYSGAFYLPNGPIKISSASGLGGGAAACLELIASQVTISSASAFGSTCTGLGGTSSGAMITLVQ